MPVVREHAVLQYISLHAHHRALIPQFTDKSMGESKLSVQRPEVGEKQHIPNAIVCLTLCVSLPFLGELWGDVGGDDSCEELLDTLSSVCFLCLSPASSERDSIFFRDCGELVPVQTQYDGALW